MGEEKNREEFGPCKRREREVRRILVKTTLGCPKQDLSRQILGARRTFVKIKGWKHTLMAHKLISSLLIPSHLPAPPSAVMTSTSSLSSSATPPKLSLNFDLPLMGVARVGVGEGGMEEVDRERRVTGRGEGKYIGSQRWIVLLLPGRIQGSEHALLMMS